MLDEIYGEMIFVSNRYPELENDLEEFYKNYNSFIRYRGNKIKAVCYIAYKIFYRAPYFDQYRNQPDKKKIKGKWVKAKKEIPDVLEVVDFLLSIGFPPENLVHSNIDWYGYSSYKKKLIKKYGIVLSTE